MFDERLVYLAAVLNMVGASTYAVATVRGRTRPHRVTWFVWAVAPLAAFVVQLGEGVGAQAALTFTAGCGPALVLLASFANSNGSWRFTRLDVGCGVLALLAIGLWLVTREGTTAIILAIAADGLAAVPTVIKAYRHPRTESAVAFWMGTGSGLVTLTTIDAWDFAHYGFPLYVLGCCGIIATLVTFHLGERVTPATHADPDASPRASTDEEPSLPA